MYAHVLFSALQKGHVGVIRCFMNPSSQLLKNVFKLSYVSGNQIGSLRLNTLHQVDLIRWVLYLYVSQNSSTSSSKFENILSRSEHS